MPFSMSRGIVSDAPRMPIMRRGKTIYPSAPIPAILGEKG